VHYHVCAINPRDQFHQCSKRADLKNAKKDNQVVSLFCDLNVDEIDTCGQFHQHFPHSFFIQKCFFRQNETREKHFCTKNAHVNVDENETWSQDGVEAGA